MEIDLRDNEQYYKIDNYTMKCRLYPDKKKQECIDRILNGLQKAYNIATYDIKENHINTVEYISDDGRTFHNVDYAKLTNSEYLKQLREKHPDIKYIPAYALSGKNGLFYSDHKRAMSHKAIYVQNPNGTLKKTHEKQARTKGKGLFPYSVEIADINYYSKSNPRKSYSYQESLNKVYTKNNNNVMYINLAKVGICKIRGWNKKIRFDRDGEIDFIKYVVANTSKKVGVTVSKDNCGDYWICFKLQNVYKLMKKKTNNSVGVDVGIKDIAILSNGTKYINKKFKQEEKQHTKILNRKLSRRQGWANQEFRLAHKSDKSLMPSKKYERTKLKLSKLQRRIARKRNLYNNQITKEIIENNGFIGVETLNVSGMFRNKHLSNALSDAAMSSVLSMLHYKAIWYERIIQPINQWTPSSKRCNHCGYILPLLSLSVREWDCPVCGMHHDRDINGAKNIEYFSLNTYKQSIT